MNHLTRLVLKYVQMALEQGSDLQIARNLRKTSPKSYVISENVVHFSMHDLHRWSTIKYCSTIRESILRLYKPCAMVSFTRGHPSGWPKLPAGPPKLRKVLNSLIEVVHESEISLTRNARFCIVHIDFSQNFQNLVEKIKS